MVDSCSSLAGVNQSATPRKGLFLFLEVNLKEVDRSDVVVTVLLLMASLGAYILLIGVPREGNPLVLAGAVAALGFAIGVLAIKSIAQQIRTPKKGSKQ